MIQVVRKGDENSQKVVGTFLKRVKKSNLVARVRKTRYHTKKRTERVAKIKALTTAKYLKDNEFNSLGKI